jgi:hypothetical protein
MQKQVIGNAIAALLFAVIAIVDFTRDTSGVGAVFLVFAAVYAASRLRAREGSEWPRT